jgi:transmembrane sensor
MSSRNQEIDSRSADWAAKRDLGGLSPQEQAEFEAWLEADPRHLGAYGRAEAVLCRVERLNGLNVEGDSNEEAEQSTWSRRRIVVAGGVAAALVAITVVAHRLSAGSQEDVYATEIGQMREVVLADGSIVSLNTNSEISVRFSKGARNVNLLRGEAVFDVAKNKHRPFIVSAGNTRVRAVGTSFMVSVLPKKPVQVLVREGVIEMRRADVEAKPVWASANMQAIARPGAPIVTQAMPEEKLARDLAWQRGSIALDNQTLADAADEFARYSEVHIIVAPSVSNRTVTGLFASHDPVGFAKAVTSVLKLRMEVKGREVRIFEN